MFFGKRKRKRDSERKQLDKRLSAIEKQLYTKGTIKQINTLRTHCVSDCKDHAERINVLSKAFCKFEANLQTCSQALNGINVHKVARIGELIHEYEALRAKEKMNRGLINELIEKVSKLAAEQAKEQADATGAIGS